MTILITQANQAEYQQGQMDGQRYHINGHTEMWDRFQNGSPAYRQGFQESAKHPRVCDPDHAS